MTLKNADKLQSTSLSSLSPHLASDFRFAHLDHYLEEMQNIDQNATAAGTDSATSVADF